MTTGQKIARLRRERGITQGALAEEAGVTRQAVSKWESDAALPDADKLVRLSELFGCTVDYLLKSREEDPAAPAGQAEQTGQAEQPRAASRPSFPSAHTNTRAAAPSSGSRSCISISA